MTRNCFLRTKAYWYPHWDYYWTSKKGLFFSFSNFKLGTSRRDPSFHQLLEVLSFYITISFAPSVCVNISLISSVIYTLFKGFPGWKILHYLLFVCPNQLPNNILTWLFRVLLNCIGLFVLIFLILLNNLKPKYQPIWGVILVSGNDREVLTWKQQEGRVTVSACVPTWGVRTYIGTSGISISYQGPL